MIAWPKTSAATSCSISARSSATTQFSSMSPGRAPADNADARQPEHQGAGAASAAEPGRAATLPRHPAVPGTRARNARRGAAGPASPPRHPVDPVEAVQATAVRESADAEEGNRQPEEVQRGDVLQQLHAHQGGRDQQREDGHGGQRVIQQPRALGHGLELEAERALVTSRRGRPRTRAGGLAAVLRVERLLNQVDASPIDGDKHVAGANPRAGTRCLGPDAGGRRLGSCFPEDAVLDFDPGEPHRDVRQRRESAASPSQSRRAQHGPTARGAQCRVRRKLARVPRSLVVGRRSDRPGKRRRASLSLPISANGVPRGLEPALASLTMQSGRIPSAIPRTRRHRRTRVQ